VKFIRYDNPCKILRIVRFAPGTDMRRAETLTWNRIGAIQSLLTPGTELDVERPERSLPRKSP
jgi:hypothetical protein